MVRYASICIAALAWFAVITQFVLMMRTTQVTAAESIIRFLSYFTILTNTLVAVYMTSEINTNDRVVSSKSGRLTGITLCILVVGLVYQIALRHIWNPEGMQRLVDELLHTFIPAAVCWYWWKFEKHPDYTFGQLARWLLYPTLYLIYVCTRGYVAHWYPYPFLDLTKISMLHFAFAVLMIVGLFLALGALLYFTSRRLRSASN